MEEEYRYQRRKKAMRPLLLGTALEGGRGLGRVAAQRRLSDAHSVRGLPKLGMNILEAK
jgi:hypothetical protein